jgi:competence protein ComEC
LLGVLLVQQVSELPSLWWSLTLIPALWLSYRHPRFLPLVFLCLGVVWTCFRAGIILQDHLPTELEGKNVVVEGVIASLPRPHDRGQRFDFTVDKALYQGQKVALAHKIRLSYYGKQLRFRPGQRWRLTVRLKRVHGFMNPGGFDYEGYMFQQRIRARGYLRNKSRQQLLQENTGISLLRLRYKLGQRLRARLGQHPLGGIIIALVNGDRSGLKPEHWNVMRRTGTNHLMAISGLHIGLVAGLVFFVASRLWALPGRTVLIWPAAKVGAVCALLAGLVYAALAGFSIPTQRALIMLAIVLLGVIFHRRFVPSQYLALALLAVLLFDPLSVMSAGFWLSFCAVGIILFSLQGDEQRSRLWRFGKIQIFIAIGLLPLTLVLFQQASLIAPLANFVAVPVFTLMIVPLALLGACALLLLPDNLSPLLFDPALWALEYVWRYLEWLASMKHSLWTQHRPPMWSWFCALIGVALLLMPRTWPGRWVGIIWLAPLFLLRPAGPGHDGEFWFSQLDVGQGLASVLRTRNHVLVFDTGPRFSASFNTGDAVVLPFLRHQGMRKIDMLIVSHGDNDHIGGADAVLKYMPTDRVLSSIPEELPGASACQQGQAWTWDGVHFQILNPQGSSSPRHNNSSCVLLVSSRYGAVLLTADIERRAEIRLVSEYGNRLRASILVAPHHGSKTSSSSSLIQAVRPAMVVFASGYRNRYRHPHHTVVARYKNTGSKLYWSSRHGALQYKIGAAGITVFSHRQRQGRYWHRKR